VQGEAVNIEIRALSKTFSGRIHALRSVDLTVPAGMYGLLGPNGAGKTTLMRVLACIYQPSRGEVRVGPHDLATRGGRQAVKQLLGYLPQELGLYPDLNAAEFLDYVGILKGMDDRTRRRARVAELLGVVGLSDVAARKLKGFSGGMKRRLGIAQALLNDPQLLIVDEPTAGLDPEERIRFRNLLVSLAGHGQRTVLLSTHIVEDVAQTSSRLAVLAAGRVIYEGDAIDLVRRARGQVWILDTDGPAPAGEVTIVSALHVDGGTRYRVVACERPGQNAQPVEPNLEDGYLALMRASTEAALPV